MYTLFNGFAIYRKAKFNNIKYDGTISYKITENQKKKLKEYIYMKHSICL